VHQQNIDHRDFVENKNIPFQRQGGAMEKISGFRVVFQQAMKGARFHAGGFLEPFGGPTCGGGELNLEPSCFKNIDQCANDGGFTHAGAPGDDRHFLTESHL